LRLPDSLNVLTTYASARRSSRASHLDFLTGLEIFFS
jgi:hypothetical protein